MIITYLLSTAAVVLAEMGDKTQLLAMAFASCYRWQTVLWAVLAATLVNHFMAVCAGNVITQFVPMVWVKLVAAGSFIIFALWTIRGDTIDKQEENCKLSPFWTVAIAFFIAEMGDKTQLMTVALAADEAAKIAGTGWLVKAKEIVPVWMGTTTGMIIADAIGIVIGIVLHKHIPEKLVKWIAALAFVCFGLLGLHETLDEILGAHTSVHHYWLGAGIILLPAVMWVISRLTEKPNQPVEIQCSKD